MVTMCVKINKVITTLILTIVTAAVVLLIMCMVKGGRATNPELYLQNLGYNFKLIDEKKIVIPKKFGENMKKYNDLQKKQGFDLKQYSGKICTQKRYLINENDTEENYIAKLLVFDGNVVGGDLHEDVYGAACERLDSLNKSS